MTLAQTAILTKRLILILIVLTILGTAGMVGYRIWYANYLAHLPPVEEKPDTKFGLLPTLNLPPSNVSSSNFSYSVDTTTGGFTNPGKLAKVYFIPQANFTLLSPQRGQDLAEKFNFLNPPEILSQPKYRFSDKDRKLAMDLDTGNFSYIKEATVAAKESTPSASLDPENLLVQGLRETLANLGYLKDELKDGQSKVEIIKGIDYNTASISLWPHNIDEKSIVGPKWNSFLINAQVITSAKDLENYLQLNFTFWPVDTYTFATYPIKTPDQAFDDLKSGKGTVVVTPSKPQVSLTSAYLAYFESDQYSSYLQPIYVFEGPEFVAYETAIINQFIEQPK